MLFRRLGESCGSALRNTQYYTPEMGALIHVALYYFFGLPSTFGTRWKSGFPSWRRVHYRGNKPEDESLRLQFTVDCMTQLTQQLSAVKPADGRISAFLKIKEDLLGKYS